jgi:CheY-like chemotaxis protein
MNILVVEDDHQQAKLIKERLESRFARSEVVVIKTEFEFRNRLAALLKNPPHLVIMDVMLRWTTAERDLPEAPPEVVEQGFYRAGLRCRQLLASSPSTARVPVIFYTFLEPKDLKREIQEMSAKGAAPVLHLQKQSDFSTLFDQVEQVEMD